MGKLMATWETCRYCTWWMWQQSTWPDFPTQRKCSPLSNKTSPTPTIDTKRKHVLNFSFYNSKLDKCKTRDCWKEKRRLIPGCWQQTAGMSGWGGQRTGSQQHPFHHPSLCRGWLRMGWRRAPKSCSSCVGHIWRRPSCWSTGWVDQEHRAEDAGNSTRRSHPANIWGLCGCVYLFCSVSLKTLSSILCMKGDQIVFFKNINTLNSYLIKQTHSQYR